MFASNAWADLEQCLSNAATNSHVSACKDEFLDSERILQCSDYQAQKIRFVHLDAIEMIDDLMSSIDYALEHGHRTNWKANTQKRLMKAKRVLECSKEKMRTSITYSCRCPLFMPDTAATVLFSSESIALCDGYWKIEMCMPMEDYAGVFIHEATHLCGTGDAAYFGYQNYPQDSSVNIGTVMMYFHKIGAFLHGYNQAIWASGKWYSIADTYYYWVNYGFCIPEVDCRL